MSPPEEPESEDEEPLEERLRRADEAIRHRSLDERIEEAKAKSPEEVDPESDDALYRYLGAMDAGFDTTHARQLIEDGIALTPPDDMDDDELHTKLWEVIHGLAKRRVFLSSTDHLSDRALYEHLWNDSLNEWTMGLDASMGDCACHLDLLGSGSEEDTFIRMKYYADDEERRWWQTEWPDEELPIRVKPPFDRDRLLPHRPEPGREG